jgi:hypothetical protein
MLLVAAAVAAAEAAGHHTRSNPQRQQQCSGASCSSGTGAAVSEAVAALADMKEALRRVSDRFFAPAAA